MGLSLSCTPAAACVLTRTAWRRLGSQRRNAPLTAPVSIICVGKRLASPMHAQRIGEAKNPGPVSETIARTQRTILEAFTQCTHAPSPSPASGSQGPHALHVSIATPRGPTSDPEDMPATAPDVDCNPTLADCTLMDVDPAPFEPGTPPSGQPSSSTHAPRPQFEPDIAPDDDEAPPPQTVLPAALQLHRSTGSEITLRCNYLTTRGAYRYQ
eukprot:5151699-Amphidinium_carterae.1